MRGGANAIPVTGADAASGAAATAGDGVGISGSGTDTRRGRGAGARRDTVDGGAMAVSGRMAAAAGELLSQTSAGREAAAMRHDTDGGRTWCTSSQ